MSELTSASVTLPFAPAGSTPQEQWAEIRSVFPIYLALAKQLKITIPFSQRNLPETPEQELFDAVRSWLDAMDQRVIVYQLRHLLQMTTLNASETGLRALIHRHLRKPSKTPFDRDKIDFLLVQYFALCAPAKIYHKHVTPSDVAEVMTPVFGEVDAAPLVWCEPLDTMLEALKGFRSLRAILRMNFIEQGRRIKESAGGMFYDPSALLAFIRFNFLLRRTLIELMHADLIFIRGGLGQLYFSGVKFLSCPTFGLSNAEPLHKIRKIADEWKQPFQLEYTERSVNQAVEKLLGLRTDVEAALEKLTAKDGGREIVNAGVNGPLTAIPADLLRTANASRGAETGTQKSPAPGGNAAPLDFEASMEHIWEQLIATPLSRGRSMTTVKLAGTRVLLSSWEVAAFVSEDGSSAEDLRRAVVARALLTTAIEAAKVNGNTASLEQALAAARTEVSRLQERVDIAKHAKDTESAVNLGISTKRLLSALDEGGRF